MSGRGWVGVGGRGYVDGSLDMGSDLPLKEVASRELLLTQPDWDLEEDSASEEPLIEPEVPVSVEDMKRRSCRARKEPVRLRDYVK